MRAAIYIGSVMHARFAPKRHAFRYRVFNFLLDIDALDAAHEATRWFSVNRFNLFSFHLRDHGPADGSSLRAWAESMLHDAGIATDGGPIGLLCFPRVLGYAFNPLSVWYCWSRDGTLQAVIHEVRNTFGERHSYLVKPRGAMHLQDGETHAAVKCFHVSPFMPMAMHYRFRVAAPADHLDVLVDEYDDHTHVLRARLQGVRRPFTDTVLMKCLVSIPLMTFKVTAMIHWQALRLLLRGFRFHAKPVPSSTPVTETWPAKPL